VDLLTVQELVGQDVGRLPGSGEDLSASGRVPVERSAM
jgi:hypothetical protein